MQSYRSNTTEQLTNVVIDSSVNTAQISIIKGNKMFHFPMRICCNTGFFDAMRYVSEICKITPLTRYCKILQSKYQISKKPVFQQIRIEEWNILLPLIKEIWAVLTELSITQCLWAALLYLTYNFAYTWYHVKCIVPAESPHKIDTIRLYNHPNPSSGSQDTPSHPLKFSKSIFLYWWKNRPKSQQLKKRL